jgi:hypothetical protein
MSVLSTIRRHRAFHWRRSFVVAADKRGRRPSPPPPSHRRQMVNKT